MGRLRRIVLYAVNGSGMGHVTRLLAVARWLRRYATYLEGAPPEILFLTSSEATTVLSQAGFASFKLPSKTVVRDAGMDMAEYRRLAKHFVWSQLGTFRPDLLVVDTFPSGSFDELFQVLDGPFKKALVLRNVRPEYAARPVFQAALRLYDVIVSPHAADRTLQVALPPGVTVRSAGEVIASDPSDHLAPAAARTQLGVSSGRRLVYLSAGGGGDPTTEPALESLVAALGERTDLHLLVGAGPLYRGRRLCGERLTWWSEPGVARFFGACDAAISAAGYNSFHELLYARVPTAFFAQAKIADDQAGRVARALDAGAALATDPTNASEVRACVDRLIDAGQAAVLRRGSEQIVPDNGARRCAAALLEPVYGPERAARAEQLITAELAAAAERTAGRGAKLLGEWLPRLLPDPELRGLEASAWLEGLLADVGEAAAEEVRGALTRGRDSTDLEQARAALVDLVNAAVDVRLDVARVMGTVEVGLKKHPASQEPEPRRLVWVAAVLRGVTGIVRASAELLSVDDRLLLYRLMPRLVDASASEAFEAFERAAGALVRAGRTPDEMRRMLQALKLTRKRVLREDLFAATGVGS